MKTIVSVVSQGEVIAVLNPHLPIHSWISFPARAKIKEFVTHELSQALVTVSQCSHA